MVKGRFDPSEVNKNLSEDMSRAASVTLPEIFRVPGSSAIDQY